MKKAIHSLQRPIPPAPPQVPRHKWHSRAPKLAQYHPIRCQQPISCCPEIICELQEVTATSDKDSPSSRGGHFPSHVNFHHGVRRQVAHYRKAWSEVTQIDAKICDISKKNGSTSSWLVSKTIGELICFGKTVATSNFKANSNQCVYWLINIQKNWHKTCELLFFQYITWLHFQWLPPEWKLSSILVINPCCNRHTFISWVSHSLNMHSLWYFRHIHHSYCLKDRTCSFQAMLKDMISWLSACVEVQCSVSNAICETSHL